jgi:hypothetical protein
LCWEIRIRSGSRSSSFKEEMHGWLFCSEWEKMELRMIDGPTIHGSTRTVNDPGKRPGDESGATGGLKMSRKQLSPFSDLMVKDMATSA